jgi:hypothetical protein
MDNVQKHNTWKKIIFAQLVNKLSAFPCNPKVQLQDLASRPRTEPVKYDPSHLRSSSVPSCHVRLYPKILNYISSVRMKILYSFLM